MNFIWEFFTTMYGFDRQDWIDVFNIVFFALFVVALVVGIAFGVAYILQGVLA